MKIDTKDQEIYAYTGGKDFDAAKPTVVFIHGVLNDHSVWILQSRYLAHHGWNVLAIDLPGHCKKRWRTARQCGRSQRRHRGPAERGWRPESRAGRPQFRFTDRAGDGCPCARAREPPGAGRHGLPDARVTGPARIVGVGAMKAIDMVNTFSHSTLAPPPSALGPGTWLYGGSRALMRRVLASNTKVNVFYTGFKACDSYAGGEAAMEKVQCPTLFVLGSQDQMTPPKAAQSLVTKARNAKVVKLPAGHSLMTEAPDGVLQALQDFLKA